MFSGISGPSYWNKQDNGVVVRNGEGTPQGGPLSPLLSNILLDDLDKELENRGHRFVRYADDCNIYVRTERSSGRVLKSVSNYLVNQLKLKVNSEKSSNANSEHRNFLGYRIFLNGKRAVFDICPQRVMRFRRKLKLEFRHGKGRSIKWFISRVLNPKIRGWFNYYKLVDFEHCFSALDGWLRHRLRLILWRQWKRSRTRYRKLRALGLRIRCSNWLKLRNWGPWRASNHVRVNVTLNRSYFAVLGLFSLLEKWKEVRTTQ